MECAVRISMCYRIKIIQEYKGILTSHGPKGVTRASISREAIDGMSNISSGKIAKTITHGHVYNTRTHVKLLRLIAG